MTSCRTTLRADEEISEIYLYGARCFGTGAADRYIDGLGRVLSLLAAYPELSRQRPEFTPPIRAHPYGSHVILYREEAKGILVLRVLGGGMDWQRHLEDI